MPGMNIFLLNMLLAAALVSGCDAFDRDAMEEYDAATRRWNEGDYRAAVAMYDSIAMNHPFSPRADNALYWAGVTRFLYLGETERGLQTLRFLLKRYPRRDMASQAQYTIAQIYELGYNDYERAAAEYRRGAEYTDREVREKSLYGLADNLFRLGKVGEACDTWLRQVEEFPRGPNAELAYYRLGTASFAKGAIDEAEAYYRKALDISTDHELAVKTKFSLAGCLEAREDLTGALKLYKEIAAEYPNREAIDIKIKALETRIIKKSY